MSLKLLGSRERLNTLSYVTQRNCKLKSLHGNVAIVYNSSKYGVEIQFERLISNLHFATRASVKSLQKSNVTETEAQNEESNESILLIYVSVFGTVITDRYIPLKSLILSCAIQLSVIPSNVHNAQ